jgi:hypothetical protein
MSSFWSKSSVKNGPWISAIRSASSARKPAVAAGAVSPGSVLVNRSSVTVPTEVCLVWGVGTMPHFRLESGGWPVASGSPSSSHYARHALSRRAFIGSTAAAGGASLGSGLLWPAAGSAAPVSGQPAPKPTTATVTINGVAFHFSFFGAGVDPSSITDFNGFVGVADVRGKGTATNPDGSVETLLFDTDMRFMKGAYVGVDGAEHKGTFGFV